MKKVIIIPERKVFQKKACERHQNHSEEEKIKKWEYGHKWDKNFPDHEK